ncbi:Hypothetical Protein SLY_0241 [Strawberry lethal yellows phytoplasma (CPA) str. NZSb11]|uniref:Uncharacterized protein n=1 Tax=Strawberry lethal yellows phytoplasma (CPA) str. NZSb11 TaxID=980422 RepID=R4S082_PHYAS|nr:Hypothetical Protein SLY_0241 [Strawberry lethal yellows phytoplasma (CPA) str. NZSb11]
MKRFFYFFSEKSKRIIKNLITAYNFLKVLKIKNNLKTFL